MSVWAEDVVRQEMGKGACLSTQTQGHTRGDGNWFRCGRGSRYSGASRNLAQEALSAHRGNGGSELEQQNQGKSTRTPFPHLSFQQRLLEASLGCDNH